MSEGSNIAFLFALEATFSLSQPFLDIVVCGKFSIVLNGFRNAWYNTNDWVHIHDSKDLLTSNASQCADQIVCSHTGRAESTEKYQ